MKCQTNGGWTSMSTSYFDAFWCETKVPGFGRIPTWLHHTSSRLKLRGFSRASAKQERLQWSCHREERAAFGKALGLSASIFNTKVWNVHRSKWLTPSDGCLDVNTKHETKLSWIHLCSWSVPRGQCHPLCGDQRGHGARGFLTWAIPKSPWVSILSRGHSWLGWFLMIWGTPPWLRKPPVAFDPSPHQNASFFTMRRLRFAASLRQLEDMAPATGNQERRPWAFFYPLDMVIECHRLYFTCSDILR